MPFVRYTGMKDRVVVGKKYFYRNHKKQQTVHGDFVSQDFAEEYKVQLGMNNCVTYFPENEAGILRQIHNEEKVRKLNKTRAQRNRDLLAIWNAESKDEFNTIILPYTKDVEFMKEVARARDILDMRLTGQKEELSHIKKINSFTKIDDLVDFRNKSDKQNVKDACQARIDELLEKARIKTLREKTEKSLADADTAAKLNELVIPDEFPDLEEKRIQLITDLTMSDEDKKEFFEIEGKLKIVKSLKDVKAIEVPEKFPKLVELKSEKESYFATYDEVKEKIENAKSKSTAYAIKVPEEMKDLQKLKEKKIEELKKND